MPSERGIDPVENAGAHHESLARTALLAGAAEKLDRAGQAAFLQPRLDRAGGGKRAGAQQIVAAAVTIAASRRRLACADIGDLPQPCQGVVLAKKGDDRRAAAIAGDKSSLNAARRAADGKTLPFTLRDEPGSGFILLKARFRVGKKILADTGEIIALLVQEILDKIGVFHSFSRENL